MTTEELAELFLAHLYQLADEAPHPNFLFSVNDFVPRLGITDREELQKAINYLGDRGLIIVANLDRSGGISAGMTIDGSIFVEKGGETGMIAQYRKNPPPFASPPFQSSPPATEEGLFFPRRTVEALLEDIQEVLERDDTLADQARKDLFSDLATLKIQLERNVKNRQIIKVVLDSLSSVPSIGPLVTSLKCIVEGYFG
ncbi:MAG: hypothetical protein ACE144_07585 [Thermodesulfobacteriota bacterium]